MLATFLLLAGPAAVSAWTELLHQPIMNKNIDAIVQPGAYTSHMHTFFGSDAITNAMPITEELQQGCYSGVNANDLSVYWIPTLYHVDGDIFTEVPVFTFGTYYTAAYSEVPIPPNFAVIAGNASAQSQEQANHPENALEWYCENSDEREPEVARMPTKTCDQHLRFSLLFPNCVNPDNIAEYAYSDSATNKCPEGLKRMPQLRLAARYNTKAVAPNGWDGPAPFQLSCSQTPGEGFCFHGDFINGWFEDAAEDMMVGDGNGRDNGRFISGARGSSAQTASCTPVDRDPENGSSDYWASLEMIAAEGGEVVDPVPVAIEASANSTSSVLPVPVPTVVEEAVSLTVPVSASTVVTSAATAVPTGSERRIGQKSKQRQNRLRKSKC